MLRTEAIRIAVSKGYRFDDEDRIIGARGKPLKTFDNQGYPSICVHNGKRPVVLRVHRLKAYFMYGERLFEDGMETRHLNGNRKDWSNENIRIGTPSQNAFDIPSADRHKQARKAAKVLRRFSDEEVRKIRDLRQQGAKYKDLVEMFRTC